MEKERLVAERRPLLVGRREAARLLGVSPGTLFNLAKRGELPPVRVGARTLYGLADLERFIESRRGVTR